MCVCVCVCARARDVCVRRGEKGRSRALITPASSLACLHSTHTHKGISTRTHACIMHACVRAARLRDAGKRPFVEQTVRHGLGQEHDWGAQSSQGQLCHVDLVLHTALHQPTAAHNDDSDDGGNDDDDDDDDHHHHHIGYDDDNGKKQKDDDGDCDNNNNCIYLYKPFFAPI